MDLFSAIVAAMITAVDDGTIRYVLLDDCSIFSYSGVRND